jgi:hypothetical protein
MDDHRERTGSCLPYPREGAVHDRASLATFVARLLALVFVLSWAAASPFASAQQAGAAERAAGLVAAGSLSPIPAAEQRDTLERFVVQRSVRLERSWPPHAPDAGLPPAVLVLSPDLFGMPAANCPRRSLPSPTCTLPEARAPPIRG